MPTSTKASFHPRVVFHRCLASAALCVLLAHESGYAQAPATFYTETKQAMTTMDDAMMQADSHMVGDPDRDFLAMMIPHHQGAIDMAKAVLLYGKDPALKNIAQEIIAEQAIEIQYMQKIAVRLNEAAPKTAPVAMPMAPVTSRHAAQHDLRTVSNDQPDNPEQEAKSPARDRVYTADQVSNTVSVIDPAQNKLLGIIKLGELPPAALLPLYKGQSLVHGLGFSPDGTRLCVVSIGSNSLTLIDTATNKPIKSRYLGRAPHEAFFTPDGKEIYAAVRGEDYVSVLDAESLEEKARIKTNPGPGMILFRPDGRYAFVPSSFTPELCVVDTRTREVIARVPQASPFSPNLAVSADGQQVWFTLKDSGKTQVMSAEPPFAILGTIASGPITNHVTCVDNAQGHFAYVTVGGDDEVKVYRREPPFDLVKTIAVGALPHGIWGAPDGSRVYVGLENDAKVQAIDTRSNEVVATIPIGQLPQALVYVPGAAAKAAGDDAGSLLPLSTLKESRQYQLRAGHDKDAGRASVTVISLGLIDQVQVAASGLVPNQEYTLSVADDAQQPTHREPIIKAKSTATGNLIADTLGPVRGLTSLPAADAKEKAEQATFVLEPVDAAAGSKLVQETPQR